MNRIHSISLLSLLISILSISNVSAQAAFLGQEITDWYLEERFLIADQNDDAVLDQSEMKAFAGEFIYYLDDHHFSATDKNKDGYLSFNEINQKRKSEILYRYSQDRKQLVRLAKQYPFLNQADESYLKDNASLVARLFSNLTWMYEHAELAEEVYKDKMWLNKHPEVLISLHNNLRWMAANPTEAKDLYRDRNYTQNLPHLLGWRAHHKDFMRSHPLTDRFYELEFIPSGIRR
jgi:hypothetical protein